MSIFKKKEKSIDNTSSTPIVVATSDSKDKPLSNVVSKEDLRKVQRKTINHLDEVVSSTYGPMNSNTLVLKGDPSNPASITSEFTKDGHTVLKNVLYTGTIENSIQGQLTEITHHVEQTVGDGTTTAVKLSAAIFNALCDMDKDNDRTPYGLIRDFQEAVSNIKEDIKKSGRDIALDDIYNISLISTNGNTFVAESLKSIYEKYGFDVFIDVSISNTTENLIKEYDGMTLPVGYSDPAYVNMPGKKSAIRDARVYSFVDPIDTPEMASFFEQIINTNIIDPLNKRDVYEGIECIPTVIITPKISQDKISLMKSIVANMYQFPEEQRPPLLVITNIGPNTALYSDISHLCGCKEIRKYIDPKIQEQDVEKGLAPTLDTVAEFYGTCELVEADSLKTKFVNPGAMFVENENGERVYSDTYNNLLSFLKAELETAYQDNEDNSVTGTLKRRINSLNCNMVEFLIGGIEIADRDSLRCLVEDAVLNCRSAAENGVGNAASFEGLKASYGRYNNNGDALDDMYKIIYDAYVKVTKDLYGTLYTEDIDDIIEDSLVNECPLNLNTEEFDHKVLCSINTDITILDAIAKIVTIMFTANQALVQIPHLNIY